MKFDKVSSQSVSFARRLRRRATSAEAVLWRKLRSRNLRGLKFRRQHPIGPYIVDFYCAEQGLVVEVDGDSHIGREREDRLRTRRLEGAGYRVIRFDNRQVHCEMAAVLEAIVEACEGE